MESTLKTRRLSRDAADRHRENTSPCEGSTAKGKRADGTSDLHLRHRSVCNISVHAFEALSGARQGRFLLGLLQRMSSGGPDELVRGVKNLVHCVGKQWGNFAQSLCRQWDQEHDVSGRWMRRTQAAQAELAGGLQGFRLPVAGIMFSRTEQGKGRKLKVRPVTEENPRVVEQDVQDAHEAQILAVQSKGLELRREIAADSRGAFSSIFVSPDTAEVELEHGNAVSKEQLGRATWTFLHTLAAQFPEKPTRQQQRDVKELMAILSRLYPCKVCAEHFKEVLKANPVQAGSGVELAQWMCRVHNVVNRSLGKPQFSCLRVDARWGALDCNEGACDLEGRTYRK